MHDIRCDNKKGQQLEPGIVREDGKHSRMYNEAKPEITNSRVPGRYRIHPGIIIIVLRVNYRGN